MIAIKSVIMVLNFTLVALAARGLGSTDFGHYSVLFSAGGLLLIIGTAGQELFVIRAWNEFRSAHDTAGAKGALHFSGLLVLTASCAVGILFLPWASAAYGTREAILVTTFVILASGLQVTSHFVRTAVGVTAGDGVGNVLQIAPAVLYLAASLAWHWQPSLIGIFSFLAAGTFCALLTHLIIARSVIRQRLSEWKKTTPRIETREWLKRSARLFGASSVEAVNQYADVLVLGLLVSPTIAGAYFVIARIANLFAAAADAINLFTTQHFSRLYHDTHPEKLEGHLDIVAKITLAFVVIGLLAVALVGYFILLMINETYISFYPELLVLCIATAALAMARPTGSILMLMGFEGSYLATIAVSATVRIIGILILTPDLGVMGAVAVTAVTHVLTAAALYRIAYQTTGLNLSFLRLTRGLSNLERA
ncbi:lipopolysaccharide biosynthesis protein [Pseudorhizobium flavum]|uniref:O-antigen/teichoic acid export membrane protein n=1 Tax=Pseudorhizobium flavum TaxID=1335061 RepID=A0A7W9Z1K3_9HYPH|nr:lipopolysaccharide biosynthesis protein [Pseudorhizobium flavum]MBB6182340.1 O-antigen/teichoic acid export membrane protein [Pseudorhizobium flavum]